MSLPSTRPRWQWPEIRARPALLLLALFSGVGVLQGSAVAMALTTEGEAAGIAPVVLHVTGAVGAWVALPIVQAAALNGEAPGLGTARRIAIHAIAYVLFTAVHVAVMFGLRGILGALVVTAWTERARSFQLVWEAQNDLVLYVGLATLWTLLHAWEERKLAALHAAQLEVRLADARLHALSAKVQPHFLFNALHTIAAVAHEDPVRTQRLVSDLGALLRATLAPGATWTLAEERAHTQHYVRLLVARFEDRVQVEWRLPPELDEVIVPRFCIQTLVENAVRHNEDGGQPIAIDIGARREGELVRIVVKDDGEGFAPNVGLAAGRGLSRLAETLRLLHGERGRLALASRSPRGARVEIMLPAGVA